MTKNPYYEGPVSDHFDGTRFFNPGHPPTDRPLSDLLRWRFRTKPAVWPKQVALVPVVPEQRVAGCRATMVGHASVLLQLGGVNVLTDPVWSDRVSPVSFAGPRRVTQPGIRFEDLPEIDLVLLSHNHYDHCDLATLRRLHAVHHPLIVTPLGNQAILEKAIPGVAVETGDWGDRIDLGDGRRVDILPAHHWSARGTRDRRMALWCGFLLSVGDTRVYVAGDTGYGDGAIFRQIRQAHGAPDFAILPIGAYAPRWFMAPQHVDPDEAVQIFDAIGARRAIGVHWGCFQLTNEPREEPATRLRALMAATGRDPDTFVPIEAGEVVDVPLG